MKIDERLQGYDQIRGSGRTTKQLEALPEHSLFIVTHQNEVDHIKHNLFAKLKREVGTLDVFPIDWLKREAWKGRKYSVIVLDHHVELTLYDWDLLQIARIHCCREAVNFVR